MNLILQPPGEPSRPQGIPRRARRILLPQIRRVRYGVETVPEPWARSLYTWTSVIGAVLLGSGVLNV